MTKDFEMKVVDDGRGKPRTAVERTLAAMHTSGWNPGRIDQARAFIKRAKKSDRRRRIEKATRKKNRRR